jgi:hypothetical protein
MNANRKDDQEDLKELMKETMNANQAKTNTNLKERRDQIWPSGNEITITSRKKKR